MQCNNKDFYYYDKLKQTYSIVIALAIARELRDAFMRLPMRNSAIRRRLHQKGDCDSL